MKKRLTNSRILAVLLALVMLFGLLPVSVLAEQVYEPVPGEALEYHLAVASGQVLQTATPTALIVLVAEAEARVEDNYTPESWAPFEVALANARAVLADDNSGDDVIEAAYIALREALDGLELLVILPLMAMAPPPGYIHVFVSFEGFNLGHGFYVPPTRVTVPVGSTAAEATFALRDQNPHLAPPAFGPGFNWLRYTDPGWGFYLQAIRGFNRGFVNLPPYLQAMYDAGDLPMNWDDAVEGGDLGEFSFSFLSGWTITVDHFFIFAGAGGWPVFDGSVVRWMFTLTPGDQGVDGFMGPRLFTMHDRGDLIRALYHPNAAGRYDARNIALAISINPLSSQADIDFAIYLLTHDNPVIPVGTPTSIDLTAPSNMYRGSTRAATAQVLGAWGEVMQNESVNFSLVPGGPNPVAIHTGTTVAPDGTVSIAAEQLLGTMILRAESGALSRDAIITINAPTIQTTGEQNRTVRQAATLNLPLNLIGPFTGFRIEWVPTTHAANITTNVPGLGHGNPAVVVTGVAPSAGTAVADMTRLEARLIDIVTDTVVQTVHYNVRVSPIPTGLTIAPGFENRSVVQGATNLTLPVVLYPPGAELTGFQIVRTSANTSIATVGAGTGLSVSATGVNPGTTTVTAQLRQDGVDIGDPVTFNVTVLTPGLNILPANVNRTVVEGATVTLPVVIYPNPTGGGGMMGNTVVRASNDTSIATVATGNTLSVNATGVRAGETTISAQLVRDGANIGTPVAFNVTVMPVLDRVTAQNVSLAASSTATLTVRQTITSPGLGTNRFIQWSSSNPAVATVPAHVNPPTFAAAGATVNTTVTAVAPGTTTITAQLIAGTTVANRAPLGIPMTFTVTVDDGTPATDRTALNAAITDAQGRTQAHYTATSWTAMQAVLAASILVRDNPGATQAQVNTATDNLQAALDRLVSLVALNAAIADAQGRTQANYTPASWTNMQGALTLAIPVRNNVNATQAQVDAAAGNLQLALDRLTLIPIVNRDALNAVIADAEARTEANYTPASWAAMQTVLATAREVRDNAAATQPQVDTAANNLQTALNDLVPIPIDRTALIAAITAAGARVEVNYTAASWANMQTVLAAAIQVRDDSAATQPQIDTAADNLQTALDGLVSLVALNAAITDAQGRTEADYTADSWADMQTLLAAAIQVRDDSNATQQQVDDATDDLNAALDALESVIPMDAWEYAMRRSLAWIQDELPDGPRVSSVGGEWAILALARAGLLNANDPWLDGWYADLDGILTVVDTLKLLHDINNPPSTGTFPSAMNRWTDFQRVTLALSSLGLNASDFDGRDLTAVYGTFVPVNERHSLNMTINVDTFALIALDTRSYEGDRERFLRLLLNAQNTNGTWSLGGLGFDLDVTLMAAQALAPYYHSNTEVQVAVDRALAWARLQDFPDPESKSQMIVLLTSLGPAFRGEAGEYVELLLNYFDPSVGAFRRPTPNDPINMMATEQAAYALVAYWRLVNNRTSLYNMSDVVGNSTPAFSRAAIRSEIARADGLTQANYTTDSWATLQTALLAARRAASDMNASQSHIATTRNNLYSAINALVPLPPGLDRASLNSEIARAEARVEANYTPASWSVMQTALTAARQARDTATTQDQIDTATYNLRTATDGLVAATNRAALYVAIATAEARIQANYTAGSWATLQTALTSARQVYGDVHATQSQINAAANNLQIAIAALVRVGGGLPGRPRAFLSVTDPNARAGQTPVFFIGYIYINPGETAYSILRRPETGLNIRSTGHHIWAGMYVEAINGFGEFDDGPLSGWMYRVNGVFPMFSASLYTLSNGDRVYWLFTRDLGDDVGAGGIFSVNRGPLNSEIARAEALVQAQFTPASWSAMQTALAAAIRERDRGAATQADIDRVLNDLRAAITALVRTGTGAVLPPPGDDVENGDEDEDIYDDETITIEAEVQVEDDGTVIAGVSPELITELIKQAIEDDATNITINITLPEDASRVEMELIIRSVNELAAEDLSLTVQSDVAAILLDTLTLAGIAYGQDEELVVRIIAEIIYDAYSLNPSQQEAVGESTAISLTVMIGDYAVSYFDGTVTVTMPYAATNPLEDRDLLTVYFVYYDGGIREMVGARYYDAQITFTTNHFSVFFVSEWISPFVDVSRSDWHFRDVRFVYTHGILTGSAPDQFSPNVNLSRAMMMTMLWRLEGRPIVDGMAFYDVDPNRRHANAIAWASANRIASGAGNNLFRPNDLVTREQLAVIFRNYARFLGQDTTAGGITPGYADAGNISRWAVAAMEWAYANGLITGRTITTLAPAGTVTRAEAAAVMRMFIEMQG